MASLGNPVNASTAGSAIINVAATAGEHYKWAKTALAQLQTNLGSAALQTAAGIADTGQQGQITQTIQFLTGYIAWFEGAESALNVTNWTTFVATIRGMAF